MLSGLSTVELVSRGWGKVLLEKDVVLLYGSVESRSSSGFDSSRPPIFCFVEQIAEPPTDPAVTEKLKEEMEGEEDLGPEERRVLERKMKKILKKEEKIKLKADGKTEEQVEAFKPIAPQQALDYLTCWAEKRKDWKFQKTRQTWLLQHMFDSEKIPDQNFSVLLTYLEGLRGQARDTTVEKAEALVRELDEGADRMAQQRAHRAREVIQLLS